MKEVLYEGKTENGNYGFTIIKDKSGRGGFEESIDLIITDFKSSALRRFFKQDKKKINLGGTFKNISLSGNSYVSYSNEIEKCSVNGNELEVIIKSSHTISAEKFAKFGKNSICCSGKEKRKIGLNEYF